MSTGEVTEAAPGDGAADGPGGHLVAPSRAGRLSGVDATRGLALFGMMAVHVLPLRDWDGTASAAGLIASGRSAATFAVLAGVGLALSTGGTRPLGDRSWVERAAAITVRAAAIGFVGLLLGYGDSRVAVILPYYALLFLFALPLLPLGPRPLAALGVGIAVLVPVVSFPARADIETRVFENPTFETVFEEPRDLLVTLLLTGYYPVLAWTTYICAGLAIGRLPLRSVRTAAGLLAGGSALALGASGLSALLLGPLGGLARLAASDSPRGDVAQLEAALDFDMNGNVPTDTWWWLVVDSPHSNTPLNLLGSVGVAAALLGALLLVSRTRPGSWLVVPLAAAGSMTLSLYSAHVLLLSSDLLPDDDLTSYGYQVFLALVFAVGWRAWVGRGPLEALIAMLADRAGRAAARAGRAA